MTETSKLDLERADELKQRANKAFTDHKFAHAIELYNEAIAINGTSAILWANRSFAHTKLEEYAIAVDDANKAVELDPLYIKGYYRRGSAHLAMGKVKEALKDFRQAAKAAPKDVDAQRKVKECEKAVKDQAFRDAISHPELGAFGGQEVHVDYTEIEVDDSYTGPRNEGDKVTLEFVIQMLDYFKQQKTIHRRYAFQILLQAKELLRASPTLVDVSIDDKKSFTVCGDIHGQFYDLLNIFEINGRPSEDNPYLFNGDFVDRGSFSVECILTLFAFKCVYPTGLYLSRGNHESKSMNKIYGFEGEVKSKFTDTMWLLFSETFCCLPLAHVLNKRVFIVHGGLFSQDGVKLNDIRAIDRFREPPDDGLMCELLWSDPQAPRGRAPSKRGVGVAFGPDVTAKFLADNNLDLVVRSHEVKEEGYEEEHNGQLITVFSAPNYCDQMGNKGAFIRFEAPNMKPKMTTFKAVPHPSVRPMQYASLSSLLS
eukprot:TRINITY_DN21784_c0_g1_i1.p1 TRINITY_DN21784_c0_g1~~TRINITY_DN21784_c0_g1_i1.p1  ORF type:complete len:484 (+),score=103.93 TRINITY_DN21784_c0_g1_i1:150-1601(+)